MRGGGWAGVGGGIMGWGCGGSVWVGAFYYVMNMHWHKAGWPFYRTAIQTVFHSKITLEYVYWVNTNGTSSCTTAGTRKVSIRAMREILEKI